jgi:nucleoside-diphosphate-sugar epimerase
MMKVVVTGAAGHLGAHLIPELLKAGFEVTGLDIVQPATSLPAHCRFVNADLTDAASLKGAIQGAALIVHCASIHPWKSYTDGQYLDANIKGTWNLYATAATLGINRIVLTSSIAAVGYQNTPVDAWPVGEGQQFPVGDLYSLTKHTQEDIAQIFAHKGQIQTIALRPPTFIPRSDLQTGFSLTGNFALVQDMASAHAAAVQVLSGLRAPDEPLRSFEAIHITNRLPYTRDDASLLESGKNVRQLVKKYWPEAYEWLVARGYQGVSLMAVYDLSKAKRLLGWEPAYNFEQWFAEHADKE